MDQTTLISFFEAYIGEVPAEMESLIYIFGLFVLLFIIDQFFTMLSALFGVSKWKQ